MITKKVPALLLSLWALAAPMSAEAQKAEAILSQANTNAQEYQALVFEGRKAIKLCVQCHGETGNSRYPDVPNLAGQHPIYLLTQIQAYYQGTRKDEFMEDLMKKMSEREKAAAAAFFANSSVIPAGKPTPVGADLYAKHCARCHQRDGRGGADYPRLAGQQKDYLRQSMRRYYTSTGRIYPPMIASVTALGVNNVDIMVNYLSGLEVPPDFTAPK